MPRTEHPPSPPTSIAPIFSIFSLRPRAVTVRPEEPAPPPDAPRRRWGRAALLGLAVLTAALGVGALAARPPKRAPEPLPVVVINGAPEAKVTDQGKPERWASGSLTVKIDASVQALGPSAVAAVQAGFGAWLESDASLPALSFDTTSGSVPRLEPDGVNAVMVAPIDIPGHKKDLAITISFVDAASGRILESDVVVNAGAKLDVLSAQSAGDDDDDHGHDDDDEVPGCPGAYDLQSVVAHEAGHFFGLGEDHEDPATTMFYKTGKCEIRKRDLEPADSAVVAALYAGPAPESAAADTGGGCGGASVAHRDAAGGKLLLALSFALLVCARRRGNAAL